MDVLCLMGNNSIWLVRYLFADNDTSPANCPAMIKDPISLPSGPPDTSPCRSRMTSGEVKTH